MDLKSKIDIARLPNHIAVIMDGNGRWAKRQGLLRVKGHESGVIAVRETVEACAELGVKNLTLYAFSTENWSRPKTEVDALMSLLISTLSKELKTLQDNDIRLTSIGDVLELPESAQKELKEVMQLTENNRRTRLVLALSYSSRWEITEAVKSISKAVKEGHLNPDEITDKTVEAHLNTFGIPDPELLIRTSGEMRISNFLLWQIAYTELYFTSKLWPDFRKVDLYTAILDYQNRERRFGLISEQISE